MSEQPQDESPGEQEDEQGIRCPPIVDEAETAALGAMLLSEQALQDGLRLLKPADFYRTLNEATFAALCKVTAEAGVADAVTVRHELMLAGFDTSKGNTAAHFAALYEACGFSSLMWRYAEIIKAAAHKRRLLRMGNEARASALDPTQAVEAGVAIAQTAIEEIQADALSAAVTGIQAVEDATDVLQARAEGRADEPRTGFPRLDRCLGGLRQGELVVVCGRPQAGKSSFLLNVVLEIALRQERPCMFFSAETPRSQVGMNLMRILARIDYMAVRHGTLSEQDFAAWIAAAETVEKGERTLFIDDTPGIGIDALRARARTFARRGGRIIGVDYIQLVRARNGAEIYERVSGVVHDLKALARETGTTVIALSQLGRPSAVDKAMRPKGAGDIEEAADVMLWLRRRREVEIEGETEPLLCMRQLKIAKNRNGPEGQWDLEFDKPLLSFREVQNESADGRGTETL